MIFKFKEFEVLQAKNAQKVGTDSMILGALSAQFELDVKSVLDIGTGTGVLGLMLAQKFRPLQLTAVDILKDNCLEAQYNFSNASFINQFDVLHGDIVTMELNKQFDFIISNPPYFKEGLLSGSYNKNKARHQSSLSIVELFAIVYDCLSHEGVFGVVYPSELEEEVIRTAENAELCLHSCVRTNHRNKFIRSFMFFTKQKQVFPPAFSDLIVRETNGSYSQSYIELTKSYHYKDLSK